MQHESFEIKEHGKKTFPFVIYRGNIPKYIHSYPLHWHNEMEIIFNCHGKLKVMIENIEYILNQNDILIISPQMIHSIAQYEDKTCEYFNILFDFSLLTTSANDICYEKYFSLYFNLYQNIVIHCKNNSELNKLISPYIKDLIINRKRAYSDYELMIKSNLFAILYHLDQNKTVISKTSKCFIQNTYHKIKTCLLYIQENYNKKITISSISKQCGFSESHFMKLFKELTNQSFIQYLLNYRLEIASIQLVETNKKIIDISEDVGFNNYSYFIRSFIKKYHLSPSQYRINNK